MRISGQTGFWVFLAFFFSALAVTFCYIKLDQVRQIEQRINITEKKVDNILVMLDPPMCQYIRENFPQSPYKVKEKLGIDIEDKELIPFEECRLPGFRSYWAVSLNRAEEVTVRVPDGYLIEVYSSNRMDRKIVKSGLAKGRIMTIKGPLPPGK